MFLSGRYPLMLRRFQRHMKVLPRQWFSILQTLWHWQGFVHIIDQNREFLSSCCYVCNVSNERHQQLQFYFIRTYSFLASQRTSKWWEYNTIQNIQETFLAARAALYLHCTMCCLGSTMALWYFGYSRKNTFSWENNNFRLFFLCSFRKKT